MPSAIAGNMLVTSSVCQSTSNSVTSLPWPLSVATSICRTDDCQSGESSSTIAFGGDDLPGLRLAGHAIGGVHGRRRKRRGSRRTTGPKWQPMRMATAGPRPSAPDGRVMLCCILAAAFSASLAVGNVDMTSSPIVLMTVPWCCSVACPHDLDAGLRPFPCAQVPMHLVEPRRADDVGKQDGEFDVFSHDLIQSQDRPRATADRRWHYTYNAT